MHFEALESKTSELDKLKVSQPTKVVTELEWDVREYQFLLNECQWAVETVAEVDLAITSLQRQDSQRTQSKLAEIRCRIESLVQGIVRKQRQAASHTMVFMVSPETRRRKTVCFACSVATV